MKLRPRGVTLVELLIVVGIVSSLLALVTAALWRPLQNKSVLAASTTLDAMALALRQLKEDAGCDGVLARDEAGARIGAFFDSPAFALELAPGQPLWAAGFTPRLNAKKKTYMEYRQHTLKSNGVADPWGGLYKYVVFTRESNGWAFEVEAIYSDGPDRVPFSADDMVREIAARPVPALAGNPAQPAQSALDLQKNPGWLARPAAWK